MSMTSIWLAYFSAIGRRLSFMVGVSSSLSGPTAGGVD